MAITPMQVTVEQLFGSKKYYIDFYQREYKWNDALQAYKPIRSLLDDIFYRFELNYKPNTDITEAAISKYDWYYLNSFMTNTVGGNTYIVDGQQRLTTLTVLTICLLKIGEKLGVGRGKLNFLEKKICDYDATGNIVFWMGFSDRVKALKAIYELPYGDFIVPTKDAGAAEKNIYEAYKTIYTYLESKLINEHIFDAFRLYLFKRIVLISIDVDEPKDVAMAFEVINDRGIPLKAYEILKGKILGIIDKSEVQHYVDMWEKSINQIADTRGDDEVDAFLSIFFQSKYADTNQQFRELQEDKYHKTIYLDDYNAKIGFKNSGATAIHCVEQVKCFVENTLPFYSDLYLHIWNAYDDIEQNLYTWLNAINEQDYQFYLTFAAVDVNDPDAKAKYKLVVREFERLYALLNLNASYKSNEFAAAVIELGRNIRNQPLNKIKDVFDSALLKMLNKAQNRTDITEPFKYELFANTEYRQLGKRFLRYFFARIDHFIAEEAQLNTGSYYSLISQAKGKDVYHIEHILANDENQENLRLFADEEEFVAQRNRLGGLVLLKGSDNQSSGNELYPEKLKTYVGNGTLFAQTLLPDFQHSNIGFRTFCQKYNLMFTPYKIFDKASIEERQRLLFEMVKLIWE